jgi:transcriptional regulator with XRE-family HTH domain
VAGRQRRIERSTWLIERDLAEVGADLRDARLRAGLTLREVGDAIDLAPSAVLRVERGRLPGPRPAKLVAHAAAVGMRARIRVFPDGEPIRDAAQVAMIQAFRRRLTAGLRLRLEVPATDDPADRRAFDALLALPGGGCALEFVTRLTDCRAQLRQLHLKMRDGAVQRMVLIVRDTRHNRRALALVADLLADTSPLRTRSAMAALTAARLPEANGIVFQ